MTGRQDQLLRRATAASVALHAVLVLVPAAFLDLLGEGAPHPGPEKGFVVSLVSLDDEPAAEPAEPSVDPTEPSPAEAVEPDTEVLPEPVLQDPVIEAEIPPPAEPVPATGTGSGANKPSAAAGSPGTAGTKDAAKTTRFQPPRLLAGALPIDPENSGDLEIPEEIPVRLRVGTTGKVIEIVPADPGLSGPVLAAIERSALAMRFAPARRGKNAVEAWFTMTFVYRK